MTNTTKASLLEKLTVSQPVYCHVHKCQPLNTILILLNSAHTLTPKILKICFNIIRPSVPRSAKRFLSKCVHLFSSPQTIYMFRPFQSHRFEHSNNIRCKSQIIKTLIMSFLHPPVAPFLLAPNILHSALFSNCVVPQVERPCSYGTIETKICGTVTVSTYDGLFPH
jgi:hypothetical protein